MLFLRRYPFIDGYSITVEEYHQLNPIWESVRKVLRTLTTFLKILSCKIAFSYYLMLWILLRKNLELMFVYILPFFRTNHLFMAHDDGVARGPIPLPHFLINM